MKKVLNKIFSVFGFISVSIHQAELGKLKRTKNSLENRIKNLEGSLNSKESKLKEINNEMTLLKRERKLLRDDFESLKKRYKKLDELDFQNRYDHTKISQWASAVKDLAGNRCDICKKHKNVIDIEAHHLYARSKHPSLSYVVENGVCLCKECHKEFHDNHNVEEQTHKHYERFKEKKRIELKREK